MGAAFASALKTAWSSDRAVVFWGMSMTALAALGDSAALIATCIIFLSSPIRCDPLVYVGMLATAAMAFVLGATSLVLAVPIILTLSRNSAAAIRALLALIAVNLLNHHFHALPAVGWLSIHPGSMSFVVLPALVVAVTFGPNIGWRALLLLGISTMGVIGFIEAGAERWINHTVLSSQLFRLTAALIPIVAACGFAKFNPEKGSEWRFVVFGAVIGALVSMMLSNRPISVVVFDEAHGSWETVKSPFGPDDFGRAVNYTYSLLFRYAARLVGSARAFEAEDSPLPSHEAVFVLKMPLHDLSHGFSDRLENWVRNGGRLLVVADHTDLYDTTQNLNKFLFPRFGVRVNSDAVYNRIGMPAVSATEPAGALFGRIIAHGRPVPWLTGASLGSLPPTAVTLASFGLSFSEPGDYSRQNRFGPFKPRTSLRFSDHIVVAALAVEHGAVAVILDSTPWSNFALFRNEYRQVFRGILHALERPYALHAWGWGALALAALLVFIAIRSHPLSLVVCGLVVGLSLGAATQVGLASFSQSIDRDDVGLRVIAGSSARLEFLRQLVGPGERNFSRIISAMAKYGFDPRANAPGGKLPELVQAKRWLLVQPDARQLPGFDEVIGHLRRGGDLTVLFAPNQAADPTVRSWLRLFGLYTQNAIGLAVAEDPRRGLLSRKGPMLLRDVRNVTSASPNSLLKAREADPLVQSYTVRPTSFPRISGLLNVGFSADQFADDAVGEVWEGVQPSSLGRHRERQLAAILSGKEFQPPFPESLALPSALPVITTSLPSFLLLENGKTVLTGRFDKKSTTGRAWPSQNPFGYFFQLRQHVVAFINAKCPKTGKRTECDSRFLGPDSIEWMVTWVANDKNDITAVELLHERRFSGLGSTVNVLFGQ